MALLDILAVDAYANSAEINDNTEWSATPGHNVVSLSVLGTTNEKWFLPGNSSTKRTLVRPSVSTGDNRYEVETHFLVNFQAQATDASGTIAYLRNSTNTSGEGLRLGYQSSSAGAGSASVLLLDTRYEGVTSDKTPFESSPVSANATYHIVLRAAGQTPNNSNSSAFSDGKIEIFINGELAYSDYNIDWGSTDSDRHWNLSTLTFVAGLSNQTYIRDIYFYDAWTTATGVFPTPGHLTANSSDSVTLGTFTNEGGATDAETALSDFDDTTFLKSAGASDELILDFTVDPVIASKQIKSVIVQAKMSRDSAAFNTSEIELRDSAGTTVLGTETESLSVIEPSRQSVFKQIVPSSSINANDFSLRIRNGS